MLISTNQTPEPARSMLSWPSNPYKGLSYYTPVDTGLFGAREREVQACAQIVSEEDLKVLLLHGTTGCGKSSFLRAGLIPFLESNVGGFQFLRTFDATDVKTLFIRCTEAPLHRLCEVLYDWGETPFRIDLPDIGVREISLLPLRGTATTREEFVDRTATSVDSLIGVLRLVGKLLPRTVVLVIDQGEEVLTLDEQGTPTPNQQEISTFAQPKTLASEKLEKKSNRQNFFDFLVAFGKATIDLKIIVAFRKEYFGDFFPELDSRRYNRDKLRAFQLQELSNEQLVEAILTPTSRTIRAKYLQGRKQPGDYYNFEFEPGLPERIVSDLRKTKTSGGVLPVLQITCERLYRGAKKREDKSLLSFSGSRPVLIRHPDYEKLGAPDTQIRQYIDEAIQEGILQQRPDMKGFDLEDERDRWKDVLHWMVYKQSDNTALTRICSEQELEETAVSMECLVGVGQMAKYLSNDDRRILRKDPRAQRTTAAPFISGLLPRNNSREPEDPMSENIQYFSLGHDAIAVELDFWGSARTVLKTRRGFVRRMAEFLSKAVGLYFLLLFGVVAYASYDTLSGKGKLTDIFAELFYREDLTIVALATVFLFAGIFLLAFAKKFARRAEGVLVRSPVFRAFLVTQLNSTIKTNGN